MVKIYKTIFLLIILSVAIFLAACNYDFLGFFASSDLDGRLKERDNLVFIDGNDWRTMALGDDYSFIVVTDVHIQDGEAYGFERLKSVIEDTAGNVKFLVILGDITQNGSRSDLKLFIDIAVNQFGVPCYPVIGNHDLYSGGWQVWRELIGSTNYRIDGGSVTLLIMDSANMFLGKRQMDWLEREVRSASGRRVFVFTHANFFTTQIEDPQQAADINERARVTSILKDKCEAMFMGHVHEWYTNEIGNVKYITVDAFHATVNTNRSYCLIRVRGGNITYEYNRL
ncbi:serine/threonine protein phosphatase [Fibrobacteres bacterium R8-0-B4]